MFIPREAHAHYVLSREELDLCGAKINKNYLQTIGLIKTHFKEFLNQIPTRVCVQLDMLLSVTLNENVSVYIILCRKYRIKVTLSLSFVCIVSEVGFFDGGY